MVTEKVLLSVLVSSWDNYYFYSMTKKTYNIITGVLVGVIVGFGNYFGYSLLERIVALIIVGVSLELLYRKNWRNEYILYWKISTTPFKSFRKNYILVK